jgi:hypothetical protein
MVILGGMAFLRSEVPLYWRVTLVTLSRLLASGVELEKRTRGYLVSEEPLYPCIIGDPFGPQHTHIPLGRFCRHPRAQQRRHRHKFCEQHVLLHGRPLN